MKLPFNLYFKNPFRKNRYVVFVDNEPIKLGSLESVDIILSPRYYWVKKENLPVKYAYQAKAYAASSFDGIIPDGNYNYLVQKKNEDFWIYAYDDIFILNEIQKLGLKVNQIGRVFFAQNEFSKITIPIRANKHQCLTNHNGFIIKVPNQLAENPIEIGQFFLNHKLSNFHVSLNKFTQLIDFKKAYLISSVLFILAIFYGTEFFWLKKVQNEQENQMQNITKTYKMPRTSIQTKALIDQLDKKMLTQESLREKFYFITKMPLAKQEYIENLAFNGKKITLHVKVENEKNNQNIQKYLQKYFKMDNVNKKENLVIYEVHYD